MKPELTTQGKSSILDILHSIVKMIDQNAPRFDEIGLNALSSLFKRLKLNVPEKEQHAIVTKGHELVSNALISKVPGAADEENLLLKGALMGLTAGVATVGLAGNYAVQPNQRNKTPTKKVVTVACYVLGGIIAAAVAKRIEERNGTV